MSALDADIAQAILQQFFTGATGGDRFIVDIPDSVRAEGAATAAGQRAAAPAILEGWRAALYAERATNRFGRDLELELGEAWERLMELWESANEILNLHYVVSVAAGEFQVRLGGVLQAGGADPNRVVPLCSALGAVESSLPALRLYELAALVREWPSVRQAFEHDDLSALAARLESPPAGDGWAEAAAAYRELLHRYGYRGQGEADPSNPDWSEEPTFALSQVRAMLAVPDEHGPAASMRRGVARREALEAEIRAALPEESRAVFDEMLEAAQRFSRMRELSKATWVLAVRRTRAPFLAIGRGLAATGAVATADDARYLTFDETRALVAGDVLADLRARVARRRQQAKAAEGYRLPDNWIGEPTYEPAVVEMPADPVRTLTGLGVSAGDGPVSGRARIIPSAMAGLARDIEPGDILVAPFTDAPWTPLFVTASAVVVETGGVLSHAATVARELGIPAVVMVAGATSLIRDGDRVTVDGGTGVVTIEA